MVRIFFWYPTEALNINTGMKTIGFGKNLISKTENMPKISDYPTVADYHNDVLQRGIFNDNNITLLSRTVGHCTIHILTKTIDLYFSLYPDVEKEFSIICSPLKDFDSTFAYNLEIDIEEIGSQPDETILLKNLDTLAIFNSLNTLNTKYSKYCLSSKNCCNLVMDVLRIGSKNKKMGIKDKLSDVIGSLSDMSKFYTYFSEMDKHISHGLYNGYQFKPLKATSAVINLCGGQTPYSVYNYVQYLRKQVG